MTSKIDIENGVVASLVTCRHCQGTGTCKNISHGSYRYSCSECQTRLYTRAMYNVVVSCAKCNGSGQQIITKKI